MRTLRRITAAATTMLTLVGVALLCTAQPAAAAVWGRVINQHSGYCMDDFAESGVVFQYPCNPQSNQKWNWSRPNPSSTDNRWLVSNQASGRCLYPTANQYYADLRLARCAGDGSQQWKWVRYAGTSYWFLEHIWPDPNTGARLCVAASVGNSTSKLVLGACQPWPAHLWYQEPPF